MHIHTHMRTTLGIDDDLLREAARLTRGQEKTTPVKRGLEALIARESARRPAALGGGEKTAASHSDAPAAAGPMTTPADTSVWVDHLRRDRPRPAALLEEDRVLCHPFVSGELACA